MTADQMRHSLELISRADSLQKKLTKYVLLKRDSATRGETIQVGDPVLYRKDEYHRTDVTIPEEARRYVFNLWRRDIARQFNEVVRELNQLGVSHKFNLVKFSQVTGEVLP